MPSVLLINPNTSQVSTDAMHQHARMTLPGNFDLKSVTAQRGAAMITNGTEMAMAVEEVQAIGKMHADSVSAVVIAAFGNPGVQQLRDALAIPVVGIGEAAMLEAATDGRRFGVATTTPGLETSIFEAARQLGLGNLFMGCRIAPGGPLNLAADPERQDNRLGDAIRASIELDGAQAVIIGGGPLASSAERLAQHFSVPIVSPISAAMRLVLAFVGATGEQRKGWAKSPGLRSAARVLRPLDPKDLLQ